MNTEYSIGKDGQTLGPWPLPEIQARLQDGRLTPADLIWTEGWPEWKPIRDALPLDVSAGPLSAGRPDFAAAFQAAGRDFFRHFWPLACITVIIWAPCSFFGSWMDYHVFGEEDMGKSFRMHMKLESFIGIIATAGILCWLRDHHQGGAPGIWSSLRNGLRFWGKIFLVNLLAGLCFIVGLLALVLPAIWVAVRLSLVEVIVLMEGTKTQETLRQSWNLTKGQFWPLFLYAILATLPGLFSFIPYAVFTAVLPQYDFWWMDGLASLTGECVFMFSTVFFFHAWKTLRSSRAA